MTCPLNSRVTISLHPRVEASDFESHPKEFSHPHESIREPAYPANQQ
jgi:hypothetical protein